MVQHQCYWYGDGQTTVSNSVGLPQKADVVIIGGGIAGISALYHLIQTSPLNAVLLETDFVGSHSSGRCPGMAGYGHRISQINRLNQQQASQYFELIRESHRHLDHSVRREEISCDYSRSGGYYYALSPESLERFKRFHTKADYIGLDIASELFSKADARATISCPSVLGGMFIADEASLHPHKFITGLAKATETIGKRIVNNAHVEEVKKISGGFEVKVRNRGTVTAKNVVYCTGTLVQDFVDVEFGIRHNHMVCTSLLSNRVVQGFPQGNIYLNDGVNSVRVHDNRLLFGRLSLRSIPKSQDGTYSRPAFNKLHMFTYQNFPAVRVSIDCVWSYNTAATSNGLPVIGPVPGRPGEYVSVGYGDYDLGIAFSSGMMIRDYILNRPPRLPAIEFFKPIKKS